MLIPQNRLFFLVGKVWALRLFGVGGGAFADAASAHEHLRLQQEVALSGLALHVIHGVFVLDVGIEAKDHADLRYQFHRKRAQAQ